MSSIWGNNLELSVFGESHGPVIGCIMDNIPSGIPLDLDAIQNDLLRRSAKNYDLATPRKEEDNFEILSGFFNGYTTGTPLCAVIRNKNTKSEDYNRFLIRPGHADFAAYQRYKGFQDYRGGGHFSGRLTAPLVLAGSIAKQICSAKLLQIAFGSRIISVGKVKDKQSPGVAEYNNLNLSDKKYPVLTDSLIDKIEEAVKEVIKEGDSLGGIIEGWITGVPAGLGNPFFGSIESVLSSLLFSIPAVKGVEFGMGFEMAQKKGSEVNDSFFYANERILTESNRNGGINGGISNGMPIVFRVVIKPTPTISKPQMTVNLENNENIIHSFKGRHDPSIVLRAPVVIESVSALAMLDLIMGSQLYG